MSHQSSPYIRQVMSLAWPAIISNITTPVLSLVDMAIVGHLPSEAAIGAVAVGGTAFNMLYWLFGFLRMGTSGITAQAYGASDSTAQSLALYRALAIALVASMLMLAISPFAAPGGIRLIDPGNSTTGLALRYFNILVWGAPAVLASYSLSGWFLGMQNSRAPMFMALVTNVSNIVISLTAVIVFGMGIEGVALGTLAAQWLGAATGLAMLVKKYHPVRVNVSKIIDSRSLRAFLSVNVYIFLRTVCLVAVTLWFTHVGALQNVIILSANAVLMQFFMLFSYFMDGFGFAAEALTGKYHGAGNHEALRRTIRLLFKTGISIALFFTAVYAAGGTRMLEILTDKGEVTQVAGEYLIWAVTVPLCGMAAFLYDGIFIGLTLARQMFLSMVGSAAAFFIFLLALTPLMGNHALWLAFVIYLSSRGALQFILLRKARIYSSGQAHQ